MSLTSPTPQWGRMLDLSQDLKPYIQYPQGKTDQDTVLQLIADSASDLIQEYLGRPIAPTQFFRRFDGWAGWGGATIMLPYYPVIEVVSITETRGTSGQYVLTEQTPENQLTQNQTGQGSNTYQLAPLTGRIVRTFPGLIQKPFFPGSRNIEVKWIAGYDPIPANLKIAALELARHWYRHTQEEPTMAISMAQAQEDRSSAWPGVPNQVMMLLQPYRQQGIG